MKDEDYEKLYKLAEKSKQRLENASDFTDNKIYNNIILTGVILSALTGLNLISPNILSTNQNLEYIYIFGLILIFVSMILSVLNYTVLSRKFPFFVINKEQVNKMEKISFKKLVLETADLQQELIKRNSDKWFIIKLSVWSFILGLGVTVFSVLYNLIA